MKRGSTRAKFDPVKRYVGVVQQQGRVILDSDWDEGQEDDLGIALVEMLAAVGEALSYYQDRVSGEAFLETARRRLKVSESVVRSVLNAALTLRGVAGEIVAGSLARWSGVKIEGKKQSRAKMAAGLLVAIVLTALITASVAPSILPLRTETITETETVQRIITEIRTETVTTTYRSTTNLSIEGREFFLSEARRFLESQYVEQCGLLRAGTEGEEGGRIYIASDNLLAQRALGLLGSPLAERIGGVLRNNFSRGYNGLHEVLLGVNISWPPGTPVNETLPGCDEFDLLRELRSGEPMYDWEEYGDLLAYHATAFHNVTSLKTLLDLFDSWGIMDKAYNRSMGYETYKLALAILAYRSLQPAGHLKTYEAMVDIMLTMQRVDGGVVTHYDGELGHLGDANTETTSLAVMALLHEP